MPAKKPPLAYVVRAEEYEAAVGYGPTEEAAVSAGAASLGLNADEIDGFERAPHFDQYAPGPVPKEALLANGWWLGCDECGVSVGAGGEDSAGQPFRPVINGRHFYCSLACSEAREQRSQARLQRAMLALSEARRRWPDASAFTLPAGSDETMVSVQFQFGGSGGPATWVFGSSTVQVAPRDLETWKAFANRMRSKRTN